MPSRVNMIKTHGREVTGPRVELIDFVLLIGRVVKLPVKYLYLYLYIRFVLPFVV